MCGRVAVPVAVRARARLPEQQGDGAAVQELLGQVSDARAVAGLVAVADGAGGGRGRAGAVALQVLGVR